MPTPSDDTTPRGAADVDLALCRATLYNAVALGFRPPTAETRDRLTDRDAVTALAEAADCFDALTHRCADVAALTRRLAQDSVRLDALAAAHRRLFGHTARGEVPPYETEYGDEALFQQPQQLGDLAGFAHAFGLVLLPDAHERIDHVSCECELLSFLAMKEAYALEAGDRDMHATTAQASRLMLRDHLARFAPGFGRRLRAADGDGFYGRLGELLRALVTADCERLGLAVGPAHLGLRPDPETCNAPLGCEATNGNCPAVGAA